LSTPNATGICGRNSHWPKKRLKSARALQEKAKPSLQASKELEKGGRTLT